MAAQIKCLPPPNARTILGPAQGARTTPVREGNREGSPAAEGGYAMTKESVLVEKVLGL
jgi:hypothetical protein